MKKLLEDYISRVEKCLELLDLDALERLVDILTEKIRSGKKIFLFGNGASAAISSHSACDLNKGLVGEGIPRVKAICLNDNIPLMTAWSNDEGYETVFREQLANLLEDGDAVIAISSSGNSPNVLNAVEFANQKGAFTIALTGMGGGKLASLAQLAFVVKGDFYEEVEDTHFVITHMLKMALKQKLHQRK